MATEERTYHSTVPNLRLVVNVAPGQVRDILFAGDTLLTNDPAVIEYCESCADKPGSYIYTKHPSEDPSVIAARKEVEENAKKAHDKVVAAGQASKN